MYRGCTISAQKKRNKYQNKGLRAISWIALAIALGNSGPALSQNNSFNFNLPYAQQPGGNDEVRAADGTTCRSSLGNSGPKFDSGVIGGPDNNDVAIYGRLTIPLGESPGRINCQRLYDLEVRRLELELKLLEQGINGAGSTTESAVSGSWSE